MMIEYVAAQSDWFVPQLIQLLNSPAAALLPALPVVSFMSSSEQFIEDDPPWATLWRGANGGADADGLPSVISTIAITEREHRVAQALVSDRYAWRGYGTSSVADVASADHHEVTLLAWSAGDAVGTMTMSFDKGRGLPADLTFRKELAAVRRGGRVVTEFTRFAVSSEADSKATISGLFDLSYVIGRKMLGVTDVVVEVNPRHVGFYRRAFGFRPISDVRNCERVNAPAVLLRLDVAELEARMREVGVNMPGELSQARLPTASAERQAEPRPSAAVRALDLCPMPA
jgi:hypothetical protein